MAAIGLLPRGLHPAVDATVGLGDPRGAVEAHPAIRSTAGQLDPVTVDEAPDVTIIGVPRFAALIPLFLLLRFTAQRFLNKGPP